MMIVNNERDREAGARTKSEERRGDVDTGMNGENEKGKENEGGGSR